MFNNEYLKFVAYTLFPAINHIMKESIDLAKNVYLPPQILISFYL